MSSDTGAILEIGGTLPAHVVEELCVAIQAQGVALDCWGDAWFEPESAEDLLDAYAEGGCLRLLDSHSRGSFDDVEAVLLDHGIPFDRLVDGDSEGPGSVTRFRPGMKAPRQFPGDCSGNIYIDEDNAHALLATLELGEIAPAIEALRSLLGLDIAPLPPFNIADPSDDQTNKKEETHDQ